MNLFLCIVLVLFVILFLLFLLVYFFLMDEPSLRVIYRTGWRDIRGLILYAKVFLSMNYFRFRNLTIVDYYNKMSQKNPQKVCFLFEDEEWTFKHVEELSNKIAHCFLREGFRRGDEVALLMENCPDYICMWLGLAKIGVVTALINTNLKAETLAYSMNVINMKGLIFGQDFAETLKTAIPYIQKVNYDNFYCYSRKTEKKVVAPFPCESLNILLDEVIPLPLDQKEFKTNFLDKALYLYTSGTTGFPKAAIFKHRRWMLASLFVKYVVGLDETHTVYNPLPLYHMAGGPLFLSFGGKVVIKRKFSASNFWNDVAKHKVTACVYIGEICRYLLNQPKVPEETQHSVQLMVGIGLKQHIWKEFQNRFKIKKIIEIFGSTEGNVTVVNFDGKTGAVGFVSRTLFSVQSIYPMKVHPETGEILRGSNGLCIRCKPGEAGELVGKISRFNQIKSFDGYLNSTDTKKKIIQNCFRKGDMAFASGDILVMDDDGYLYFKDRSGDTFRWKGENVSTTEVEEVVSKILSLAGCIVYGVKIPGCEGRIGMAAIEIDGHKSIDFEELCKNITNRLPAYAVPAFLRISSYIEKTGTHKPRKMTYQEQGYNLREISDPLYVLDRKKRAYVPLTKELYNDVIDGRIKF